MSAVIALRINPLNARALQAVRSAINARADAIHAPEKARRQAVSLAISMMDAGSSAAWAVAEAARNLNGYAPATHSRNPTPPEAA